MMTRPPAFDRIRGVLHTTRSRLQARAGVLGLGWMLAAAGAIGLLMVLLAGTGLDWPWMGPLTVTLVTAGALAMLVAHFGRPLLRYRRDEAVAAHLEAGLPELHDGLLASVQFGREWPDRSPGSPAMVAALAEQVAHRLAAVDLAPVTPFRPVRRAWGVALCVAASWGLFALVAPDTVSRGLAALMPRHDDRPPEEVGPLVGDLSLTLYFPVHTAREPREIPNSAGDFEAPKGTRVLVTATTLEPVQSASIRLGKGAELPLTVVDGRDLRGELVVTGEDDWRFAVVSTEGDSQVEGLKRRIRVEPDHAPTVTLHLPAEDMELDDLRAVPVAFEARDDFGLGRAAVVVSLAEDGDHPEKVDQPGARGLRFQAEDEIDLSIIQAQPGDRVAIYVEAYDNNAVDGPQRGVSVTRFITVNSPQMRHYELSEKLRETIDLLIDALADRLEVEWYDGEAPPIPARIASLMAVTDKAAAALANVVEQMADDPLTPEEVRLALAGRLGTLEKGIAEEKKLGTDLAGALEARADAALRKVDKGNQTIVDALEQTIVLVEAMVARLALEDMAALTQELQAARERIKDLVKELRNNPNDEALKARAMREIQRLRQRMQEMQARMAQLRQKLPEEFLNIDGLKKDEVAKGLQKTQDQLSDLEKMLQEGKIDEALAALDEMQQALDELSAQLDQDMNDLHGETNPEMQKAISELMDQTRDLMKRQEQLQKETDQMAREEAEQLQKMLEEELGQQLAEIDRKAEKIRQNIEKVEPRDLPSIAEDELNHLQQRVDELNGALDRKQLMEALEMAERSLDHLDNLERFSRHFPQAKENSRLIQESQQLDRQVADELAQLLRNARQRAQQQQGDGERGRQLGQQQSELAEATRKLRQRMQERAQTVPGLGQEPMQKIEQAANGMDQASQQLGEGRPRQAQPGQQQAMSELQGVMEGLKQATRPQRAERQTGRGRQNSKEKVRIPGADEYQAPEAFRKDLLEAMKDRAPEEYREQVKRYYESLIR